MKKGISLILATIACSLFCTNISAEQFPLAEFSRTNFDGWTYYATLTREYIDLRNVRFFYDGKENRTLTSPRLNLSSARGLTMSFAWIVDMYSGSVSNSDPVVEILDASKNVICDAEYIIKDDSSISNKVAISIELPENLTQGYVRLSAPKATLNNFAYIQEATVTGSTVAGVNSNPADEIHIWGTGKAINVKGAEGKALNIYTIDGQCVLTKKCESALSVFEMDRGDEIYIVKIENLPAVKIAL